jgi:6-phosphofructokinase 2
MMPTIVTLTMNPAIDTSTSVEHVAPERKLYCQQPRHDPGGGGINVSRAIHKLGGVSLALYPVGGPTGEMLRHLLEQEKLTHYPLPIAEWTRENFVALDETSGQQYRFGMPGPTLQKAEWQQCLDTLSTLHPAPDYLVASGSLPPGVPTDFYERVVLWAREIGARTIVDTPGDAFRAAARAGVYLLKPNLRELSELVDQELSDEVQQEAAAMDLVQRGHSEVVVLSLGAAGVLLVSAAGCERLRAPTVPIQSKIGAGDSTVAGIVLSLARGQSLREAVTFGIAAGAAAVMTPGTELCRREDTERLYARMLEAIV